MDLCKLVATHALFGVHPYTSRDRSFDLRIEVFSAQSGVFRCQVWIVEEYRIVPTDGEYNTLDVRDPEFYADKFLPALMDAHGFDDIRGATEGEVLDKTLAVIRALFDFTPHADE